MTNFTPTAEQQAIIDAAGASRQSIMIKALAGCTKTTTLEMASKVLPLQPSLALAFNKKIAKEMESRLPSFFETKTINSIGHSAWGRAIGKRLTLNDRKLLDLLKEICKREKVRDTDPDTFSVVLSLVRKARVMGLVPAGQPAKNGLIEDNEDGWLAVADAAFVDPDDIHYWLAKELLRESIRAAYSGVVDFDDQIYMSALFGGVFPRYPVVMVDEAQDLSPLNHIQIAKCAADRLIVVGDPCQAIYAFRGADSASMDSLRRLRSEWIDLPLKTTFRCPKAIVARQQEHAPGFTAAPSAPDGAFHQLEGAWTLENLPNGPIAILCRNNAPLFAAALRLISKGHGCTVMGREVGKALITLSRKLFRDDETPISACIAAIHDWKEQEIYKANITGKEGHAALVDDKAECLLAVAGHSRARDAGALRTMIEDLFAKENMRITLATGHKAKGLEWPNVVHLDPWRVPSKQAKKAAAGGRPAALLQEKNLRYVIETRAKHTLINANFDDLYAGQE